jgi:5-methylthioadenosine/S-adenosylhomocysteine deaminase
MSRLLHGGTIITMDAERRILHGGGVLVDGDRIVDVGDGDRLRREHPSAEVLDCSDRVVIPGLVNTHTHLFQTLLKGLGDDLVLKDWFVQMTGPSAAELTDADVRAAARHGAVEAIRSGTTTIADFMYVHPTPGLTEQVVAGLEDVGIRGVVGRGYMTTGTDVGVPPSLIEDLDVALDDATALIRKYNTAGGRITVALAPTMIWTVDRDALTATREVADREGASVMMHVSETSFEIDNALQRFGRRDVEVLDESGLLGPDLLAVHCVKCNDGDIELLRRHDVKVSHNPCSNLYLASGVAPIPAMLRAGLAVGLASDGPASNNNHNMIHALKFAALTHKGHHQDATIITAETVLEMATIGGAQALGLERDIGSIESGKKADLVVLELDNAFTTPLHDPVSALVYSAVGDEPRTVLVDGVPVLHDGAFPDLDEFAIRRDATTAARRLAERAGTTGRLQRPWRSVSTRAR